MYEFKAKFYLYTITLQAAVNVNYWSSEVSTGLSSWSSLRRLGESRGAASASPTSSAVAAVAIELNGFWLLVGGEAETDSGGVEGAWLVLVIIGDVEEIEAGINKERK